MSTDASATPWLPPPMILVHSPLVGPLTWRPVAAALAGLGRCAVVPSLAAVAEGGAPYWRSVLEAVDSAARGLSPGPPVVLVMHSNSGVYAPVLADGLARPVAALVFVDASLPAQSGPTPVADPEFRTFLRPKAASGRLPPWTAWWDEADLAQALPDAAMRQAVIAETPRLPLAYFESTVPDRPSWRGTPCGYIWFGPPYDREARQAAALGWPVRRVTGGHLNALVQPERVARALCGMVAELGVGPPLAPAHVEDCMERR